MKGRLVTRNKVEILSFASVFVIYSMCTVSAFKIHYEIFKWQKSQAKVIQHKDLDHCAPTPF